MPYNDTTTLQYILYNMLNVHLMIHVTIHQIFLCNNSLSLDFLDVVMFGTNRESGNEAGAISGWMK